jgi:hypothetical protein
MERILRTFTAKLRDQWDTLLPLVMFAYNTTVHSTTGVTPYEAMFGHPCPLPFETAVLNTLQDTPPINTNRERLVAQALDTMRPRLATIWASIVDNVKQTQIGQARRYNRRHRHITLRCNEQVLLSVLDRSKEATSRKLRCPWYGPYTIDQVISPVLYKLKPSNPSVKASLVESPIHIQRLKKLNTLSRRFQEVNGQITIDDDDANNLDTPMIWTQEPVQENDVMEPEPGIRPPSPPPEQQAAIADQDNRSQYSTGAYVL